jgi:hypothetical protein
MNLKYQLYLYIYTCNPIYGVKPKSEVKTSTVPRTGLWEGWINHQPTVALEKVGNGFKTIQEKLSLLLIKHHVLKTCEGVEL